MASRTVSDSNHQQINLPDYECPICTDYLWPPIYKCYNGHSVCKKCINKILTCPICRENLPFPRTRDTAFEATVTRYLFPCEFSSTGCTARVKLRNMEPHKEICKFRTGHFCVSLGIPNCQATVSLARLVDHAQTAHGIPCISIELGKEFDVEQLIGGGSAQNVARVTWKPVFMLVKATSNVFLLRTASDSGKIRWTIQDILIYRSSRIGDHVAVISFIQGPSQKYCQTWTGPLLKHDANLEDMDSWFVLPSKNIEGRSAWNLKICIKPGTVTTRVAHPACMAVNEMNYSRPEPARPPPAPRVPAVPNPPHTSLPEISRIWGRLTCGICHRPPISTPALFRPTPGPPNTLWKTVPYCQSCFSDYRGSISEMFFVFPPETLPWLWDLQKLRFQRKEGMYEEHFYIFPPSLGIGFALRRLVRLVTCRDGWLGVTCHGCNAPILGWRFQCAQCFSLSFCRRCYLEEKKHVTHMAFVTSTRRFRYLLKQRLFWKLVSPCLLGLLIPYGIARTFILPTHVKVIGISALVCNSLLIALLSMHS